MVVKYYVFFISGSPTLVTRLCTFITEEVISIECKNYHHFSACWHNARKQDRQLICTGLVLKSHFFCCFKCNATAVAVDLVLKRNCVTNDLPRLTVCWEWHRNTARQQNYTM